MAIPLIVDNPYRVLGVSTQVKNSAIAANYKSMMNELIKGRDISLGQDMSVFIKEPLRTSYRLDIAKSQLMSARGRIFHGLFWFIDSNRIDHAALYYLSMGNKTKAMNILQSEHHFSSYINLAVIAMMEERYDDAAALYSTCLQDEVMTQEFVSHVIGDKFKIKGVFVLSKVLDVINKEKERIEANLNMDERSVVGAGHGVRSKESQQKIRLVPDVPKVSSIENLQLRKQAISFDKHLNEALRDLIERIALINNEYGMDGDFHEVDLNPNPAALLVLDEISRFLSVNNTLMEAFRKHCLEVRERSLYLDYVYNLVSIAHYACDLYAIELGRQYSNNIVQQLRSIIAKLERLYFRIKADDVDFFIASLRRIEDALPYFYEISNAFNQYYVSADDQSLVPNFFSFYSETNSILNRFSRNFGLNGKYVECGLHLQNMVVRYNVSFMSALVNLALLHPYLDKVRRANWERRRHMRENFPPEAQMAFAKPGQQGQSLPYEPSNNQEIAYAPDSSGEFYAPTSTTGLPTKIPSLVNLNERQAQARATAQNEAAYIASAVNEEANKKQKLSRAERKRQKEEERRMIAAEERRANFFKRKLSRERENMEGILERFESYSLSPSTHTLIDLTKQQLERLPPPVSIRGIAIGAALISLAIAGLYLNLKFL